MQTYYLTISSDESSLVNNSSHSYALERGQTILKNFMLQGIKTKAKCGGKAICGECRIKVLAGSKNCNKPVSEEKIILKKQELKQGWRLACQLYCLTNVSIFVP